MIVIFIPIYDIVVNKQIHFKIENTNALALDCFSNLLHHLNYSIVVQIQLKHTLLIVVGIDDVDCYWSFKGKLSTVLNIVGTRCNTLNRETHAAIVADEICR